MKLNLVHTEDAALGLALLDISLFDVLFKLI
jgi:hypothetical protein